MTAPLWTRDDAVRATGGQPLGRDWAASGVVIDSRAIRAGELVLYCQPKLDLADRTINSVEMLVRWRHPDRGMVPPGKFIPLAEQTGLIDDITDWVVDRTVSQLHSWRQAGLDVQAAVNLSAASLTNDALLDRVVQLLKT